MNARDLLEAGAVLPLGEGSGGSGEEAPGAGPGGPGHGSRADSGDGAGGGAGNSSGDGAGDVSATGDVLVARGYRHAALDDRVVVRLVPEALGEAEDLALEFLGFAGESSERVGRVRRQSLGFPAWALVNDPANGRHALAVVKEMERLARLAPTKPGNAKDGFDEIATRLDRSVPHFLPTYYEQVARLFLAAESTAYASTYFSKAREAERRHALPVDEERLREVFLEFAAAGALSGRTLREQARGLAERLAPQRAFDQFRALCLERAAAGLTPYSGMLEDLRRLARSAGLDVRAEEVSLLAELLPMGAVSRAPVSFWTAARPALVEAAGRHHAVRVRLLHLLPSVSRGQEAEFDGTWLDVLESAGAFALLADGQQPAAGSTGAAAGAAAGTDAGGGPRAASGAPAGAGTGGSGAVAASTPGTAAGVTTQGTAAGGGAQRTGRGAAPAGGRSGVTGPAGAAARAGEQGRGSGGQGTEAPTAAGWFSAWTMRRQAGYHRPTGRMPAELRLVERFAAQLAREGEPVRLAMAQGHRRIALDLLDTCLASGVPVADPHDKVSLDLYQWLTDKRPGRRNLAAVAADPRFAPLLRDAVEALARMSGGPAYLPQIATHPVFGPVTGQWLADRAAELERPLGLPGLDRQLRRLAHFADPDVVATAPAAVARIAAVDPAPLLARTLRAGILDELGWPALDEAVQRLQPAPGTSWQPSVYGGGWHQMEDAWPALVVAHDTHVAAVGPDGVLDERTLTLPAPKTNSWGRTVIRWTDGQWLIASGHGDAQRAVWSGRPADAFRPQGRLEAPWRGPGPVSLPLPGGGRFCGSRPVRAGDTSFGDRRPVASDGISYWVLHENRWYEYDPVTARRGRACVPAFFDGALAEGGPDTVLVERACWLLPVQPGLEGSPFGSKDGRLGWWVRYDPAARTLTACSVDGTRSPALPCPDGVDAYRTINGEMPVPPLRLPGTVLHPTVSGTGRDTVRLHDADGLELGRVEADTPGNRYAGGTVLVPPLWYWHALRPRDEAGSAALRAVTDEQAAALIAAMSGPGAGDPAGDGRAAGGPAGVGRAAFGPTGSLAGGQGEPPGPAPEKLAAVRAVLPAITHPALVMGVAALAAEAARSARRIAAFARQAAAEPVAPQTAPVVHARDGALNAALAGLMSHGQSYVYGGTRANDGTTVVGQVRALHRMLATDSGAPDAEAPGAHPRQPPTPFPGRLDTGWSTLLGAGFAAAAARAASVATSDHDRNALLEFLTTALAPSPGALGEDAAPGTTPAGGDATPASAAGASTMPVGGTGDGTPEAVRGRTDTEGTPGGTTADGQAHGSATPGSATTRSPAAGGSGAPGTAGAATTAPPATPAGGSTIHEGGSIGGAGAAAPAGGGSLLADPRGRLRVIELCEPERAGKGGVRRVLRAGGRRLLVLGLARTHDGHRHWSAVEYAPDGRFGPWEGFRLSGEKVAGTPADPGRTAAVLRLVALVRDRGPVPYRAEVAERFAALTGVDVSLAALLLLGLPQIDGYGRNGIPDPATLALAGLRPTRAVTARDALRRLGVAHRRRLLARLVPADAAAVDRLWEDGFDADALAEEWVAIHGRQRPVPIELLERADREKYPAGSLSAAVNPELQPELTGRTTQRLADGRLTVQDQKALLTADGILTYANALRWLAYRLPYGDPLRAVLPETLRALRTRLADDGLLLEPGVEWTSDGRPAAPRLREAYGLPETGGARPDGCVYAGPAIVLLPSRYGGGYEDVLLRSAPLLPGSGPDGGPDHPALTLLAGLQPGNDRVQALRDVLGGCFTAMVAADGPAGAAQDPQRSAPDLVAEAAQRLGRSDDAAALYLMLLALPDPTDRNLTAWTAWKPARARRARAELAATDLVVEAKRTRAGRTLFLPGGWLDRRAPGLPMESWKAELFMPQHRANGVFVIPDRPVPDLFRQAWQRVVDGDTPGFEEFTARRTGRGRR